MKKRIIALLLSLVMLTSLLTPTALAEEETGTAQQTEEPQEKTSGVQEAEVSDSENAQQDVESEPEQEGEPSQDTENEQGDASNDTESAGGAEAVPAVTGEYQDEANSVTVSVAAPEGAFPEGTEVVITPISGVSCFDSEGESPMDLVQSAIEEATTDASAPRAMAAYDITFYNQEGEELQPAEGYSVDVTFTVAAESALLTEDTRKLQVFHVDEGSEVTAQPVGDAVTVPANREESADPVEVSVQADAFSIYALSGRTRSSDLRNERITIIRGEDLTLKSVDSYSDVTYTNVDTESEISLQGYTSQTVYYKKWESSNTGVATVVIDSSDSSKATVTIGASDGETVITYKYSTRRWSRGDWVYTEHSESLTIIVKSPSPLYIKDTIPTNGCLIPQWRGTQPSGSITYEWVKSEDLSADTVAEIKTSGAASDEDAVSTGYAVENGVNVAVDNGGKCWYYVKATVTVSGENGADDTVTEYFSDPYWVPYSNKLENGSFEVPTVGSGYNIQLNQDDAAYALTAANVSSGVALWWKTMGRDGAGHDIELVRTNVTGNNATELKDQFKIDVNKPADLIHPGNQFAEINAEAYGSLYQDVLTAPGTELNWSLMHRGRWGTDTMAVVIMPADRVGTLSFNDQTSMREWVDANVGYNSDTGIFVKKLTTANTEWKSYASDKSYVVPEGQYLTRFFFIHYEAKGSKDSSSGTMPTNLQGTVGNLVDGINFSDEIAYTIRFYVNDNLNAEVTGQAKPFTQVTADTRAYSQYALSKIEKNGQAYGSTSMRLVSGQNLLEIYYVDKGMSVVKDVAGIPEDLELNGYTVTFLVYEAADITGTPVATATVTIKGTERGGTAEFMQYSNPADKFIPDTNKTYTVVETGGIIPSYKIASGNANQTVTISKVQAATVTFTNVYEKGNFDITITKKIEDGGTPDQSFIFDVKDADGNVINTVVMTPGDFANGECTVTIKDMESGTYTVTERTDWSWRYGLTTGNDVIVNEKQTSAEFTNKLAKYKWLSGSCAAKNLWSAEGISATGDVITPTKKEDEDE